MSYGLWAMNYEVHLRSPFSADGWGKPVAQSP